MIPPRIVRALLIGLTVTLTIGLSVVGAGVAQETMITTRPAVLPRTSVS